ncbi:RNA polymerase II degradation factor 1 isoform X2 [Drosophila ficusphila]|uniref:RNA polymerase II degradation factor 1 isoform X2 n=1 Tax=Drosophila ficusphila TaxID=30025 RepID=UPI0007E6E75C|nr:RNA polymerase II degradation factor 1 isoform X2 [Drosophila ficusphila]
MFPQAELENYKLQVELLQEKLQRSEDNRQQLEHKLDKVLQKRSELDKSVRHKSRQKYQEFLEEQAKRNERNKKLVKMLEKIDEQTAALSQRSERLKMMKYQMYFANLVQNQTLRCIQQTTATTTSAVPPSGGGVIPVLVQPQPQVTVTNPQPMTPQNWTFAMATPTQAGMLLTPQFATAAGSAAGAASNPNLNPNPVYYPELFGGTATPLGTSNLFDLRATLRALDNENADLPERMHPHLTGDYQAELGSRIPPAAAAPGVGTAGPATPTSTISSQEKGARQLSSTSSTLATSSLTFDKLPKTSSPSLTLTELPPAGSGAGEREVGTTSGQDVGGQPQREAATDDLDAWTNSRVTKVEYEKSPTVVGHNEPNWGHQPMEQQIRQQQHQELQQQQHQQQQQQQQHQQRQQQHQKPHDFEAYFGELKIDESWQEDKRPVNVRSSDSGSAVSGKVGISNDLLDEVKASRAALERAAAAVDEQLARGNQLSPPSSQLKEGEREPGGGTGSQPKTGVSIENIENAIYGERLTGGGATATAGETGKPTQGFFENLLTDELQEVEPQHQQQMQQQVEPGTEVSSYGQYDASSYGDASEPIYASIDSASQLPANGKAEPLYSEIGNPTDYQQQQYATADPGANGDAPAAVAGDVAGAASLGDASGGEVLPQEYSNIDYGNYEAGQYADGYDPNAYPGYIYDEATGQYIADPNAAQYAPDGSYAGQDYDAGAAQSYDYSAYEQQQQQQQQPDQQTEELSGQEPLVQQQQQQQEAYPVGETETPEVEASPAAAPPEPPAAASKPLLKPTSILSTTDKQAAPNDAQQQQLKKKKRVNFVDSSETDDSSSAKPTPAANPVTASNPSPSVAAASASLNAPSMATPPVGGSESDFDFSTGSEAKN